MQTDNEKQEKEELQESELLKLQREKYERIIADKNKIIAELLNEPSKENNKKDEDEDDEDEEVKQKKLEEERKQKRMAYYKKHIIL